MRIFNKKYFSTLDKYSHIKSCLFVPGNQEKMLNKSFSINSNVVVPDLEDSVPLEEKKIARKKVLNYIEKFYSDNINKKFLFTRLNSLTSGLLEEDLESLLNPFTAPIIEGFVIPKLNTPTEYKIISNLMRTYEKKYKLKKNKIKLIVWIESTLGILNIKDIFKCNEKNNRIIASAFGAEDFCSDFEIERSENLKEIEVARSIFSMTSHAFKILPFDTPNIDFKNPESIKKEIDYVKKLGFKGKFAIHPSQVEIINKGFRPSDAEIEWANLIKTEYEKGLESGRGSIEVNGKMVDVPVYRRALKTLERSLI